MSVAFDAVSRRTFIRKHIKFRCTITVVKFSVHRYRKKKPQSTRSSQSFAADEEKHPARDRFAVCDRTL